MIAHHRQVYANSAFEAELQIEAVRVQPSLSDTEREKLLAGLQKNLDDARAAEQRMDEMLQSAAVEATQRRIEGDHP